ncbi:MAG: DUF4363 family protein [Faecalibacterium sp.]
MKRIITCIGIVVLLVAVAFYSSFRVQRFAEEISDALEVAIEAVRNEENADARQSLVRGAELCEEMRRKMHIFLRVEDFAELEASLRAADGYLEQDAPEEALGEMNRAQVAVENLDRLARRLI